MLQKFKLHLQANFSFLENQHLFLAVSGGLDSMVMLHLFEHLQYTFAVLHCNFHLRANESNEDEEFVKNYCDERRINWSVGNFQTKDYAKQYKVSTQVAARQLRYEWFEEQLLKKNYQYVLTAHHLDDSLETFIINLSRGTGIEGLMGIPAQNKNIVRPLLPFSRSEIEQYAEENKILWREDSSNNSDDYLRNKIRHKIVPELKNVNDNFLNSFYKTQFFLNQSQQLITDALDIGAAFVIEKEGDNINFKIENLLQLSDYKVYLIQWLKDFGFTAWQDIYALPYAENGKKVLGDFYQIQKYRDFLVLSEIVEEKISSRYLISDGRTFVNIPIKLTIKKVNNIPKESEERIFVDYEKLVFPLELRRPFIDDVFYPKGMKGSKKISKYMKDERLSYVARANIWLLVDATNTIIWVVGQRQDQRFTVTEDTNQILKIIYAK